MSVPDLAQLWDVWQRCMAAQQTAPQTAAHTTAAHEVLDDWLPYCGEGGTFLDVGCGTGWLREYATAHGWQYTGLGFQAEADVRGDMHFTNAGQYDVVFCRHMVEHSPMPILAVTKLHEFTKPGGWCFVMTPAPPYNADYPDHFSVMSRLSWISLFRRVGYMTEQVCTHEIGDGSAELRFLLRRPADD